MSRRPPRALGSHQRVTSGKHPATTTGPLVRGAGGAEFDEMDPLRVQLPDIGERRLSLPRRGPHSGRRTVDQPRQRTLQRAAGDVAASALAARPAGRAACRGACPGLPGRFGDQHQLSPRAPRGGREQVDVRAPRGHGAVNIADPGGARVPRPRVRAGCGCRPRRSAPTRPDGQARCTCSRMSWSRPADRASQPQQPSSSSVPLWPGLSVDVHAGSTPASPARPGFRGTWSEFDDLLTRCDQRRGRRGQACREVTANGRSSCALPKSCIRKPTARTHRPKMWSSCVSVRASRGSSSRLRARQRERTCGCRSWHRPR